MRNKCCFIVPYFGQLPDSFAIFLKTCEWNPEFNWIVFTDDNSKYQYPDNVRLIRMTYIELCKLIDKKMGFHVAMERAYKLCDIKPAYGYIFEEYLTDYQFWGHCDIDTIMGNLAHFLKDELLDQYDKLFCMGHFILYRNSKENNRLFMSEYQGKLLYKEVFTNPNICWFDEEWNGKNNINQIFHAQGKSVFQIDFSANFSTRNQRFVREYYMVSDDTNECRHLLENKCNALYFWDKGCAFRIRMENGKLYKDEFMYMHFQWRKMRFNQDILVEDRFKIVPNAYLRLKYIPSCPKEFKKIRKWTICFYRLELFWKREISGRYKRWKKRILKR